MKMFLEDLVGARIFFFRLTQNAGIFFSRIKEFHEIFLWFEGYFFYS